MVSRVRGNNRLPIAPCIEFTEPWIAASTKAAVNLSEDLVSANSNATVSCNASSCLDYLIRVYRSCRPIRFIGDNSVNQLAHESFNSSSTIFLAM